MGGGVSRVFLHHHLEPAFLYFLLSPTCPVRTAKFFLLYGFYNIFFFDWTVVKSDEQNIALRTDVCFIPPDLM